MTLALTGFDVALWGFTVIGVAAVVAAVVLVWVMAAVSAVDREG